eukprot:ANDGO_08131.mRNA.1 Dynein intermediate chain 2
MPPSKQVPVPPSSLKKPGSHASPAVRKQSLVESATPQKSASSKSDLEPERVRIVPSTQLKLEENELGKEITKILRAENPNAPRNIVRFSHKERQYKMEASVEQTEFHVILDPLLVHKNSAEGREQLAIRDALLRQQAAAAEQHSVMASHGISASADMDADGGPSGDSVSGEEGGQPGGTKGLRNQFNFSDRASQTFNNPKRDRAVETEPPAVATLADTASASIIFDAFMRDLEEQQRQKEKSAAAAKGSKFSGAEKGKGKGGDAGDAGSGVSGTSGSSRPEDVVHSSAMARVLRFAERMVNQNTFDDVSLDFAYWEDDSDRFREEGTLLPLWHFKSERGRKKCVTALTWNPEFVDMFAVGHGSYDFSKQSTQGVVCCYSLKNPSNPEYTFTTESGIMSLDFHPQHSSLLAVGCYDGTVLIFDVRAKTNRPIFASTIKSGKHTDPVWQVHWQGEDFAKNLNFFSVSSDGRVTNWTLSKNELQYSNVMELKLLSSGAGSNAGAAPSSNAGASANVNSSGAASSSAENGDASLAGLAGGSCFDFNKISSHLFLVGTEEGRIHKCSKAYNSQYLETYEGHHMAVYAVRWNPCHPGVFLSCSADWSVKLWDHNCRTPIMSFDLGNAVGDVAWSPYSSTVFAAVTDDGKVFVFDLAQNKHEPMCEQQIVKKSKLTHVSFNPTHPVILVGDDKGTVYSFKLSPNLRKAVPSPDQGKTMQEAQAARLDTILAMTERFSE